MSIMQEPELGETPAQLPAWEARLRAIASEPLEFCPEFPSIASRVEAWWHQDCIDRPVFLAAANGDPSRPITRRLELLDNPEAWLEAKRRDMMQTHRVGDFLPQVRVDFGPVLLGSFFGGARSFGGNTGWTHAYIDDSWSNAPDWTLDPANPWWQSLDRLLHQAAADAAGRYVVCTPDLGGSADVLLNLRGASELCLDTLTQPERVRGAIDAMFPVWKQTFEKLYDATVASHGAGLVQWFGLWSNLPYHAPACDFNYMIGPAEFQALCLPDVARQAAAAGRACFHLDGPQAAKHIDALLEVPAIHAIQFTPGAQAPSALPWIPMFQKIQESGRSVLVFCPAAEVLELCGVLRPEGLAIHLDNPPPVAELDALYASLCQRYGSAR